MTRGAYYNEIDPYAARFLRNLIAAGHIAPGDVDTQSIEDVKPHELRNYAQCHFFAGVGIWSLALRRIGWADDRPIWTGSCPCQPFSAAGKGLGVLDERHLWPAWFHLITNGRPARVVGEQVANGDGLTWLDIVQADMEAAGYSGGALDLCAAGFGAPHIRQRLYMAYARGIGSKAKEQQSYDVASPYYCGETTRVRDNELSSRVAGVGHAGLQRRWGVPASEHQLPVGAHSLVSKLEYTPSDGRQQRGTESGEWSTQRGCRAEWVGDTKQERHNGRGAAAAHGQESGWHDASGYSSPNTQSTGPVNGFWVDADWLACTDGKWRPVEPGTFPLAHGAPARVGRLRAYGNGLNLATATNFLKIALDM